MFKLPHKSEVLKIVVGKKKSNEVEDEYSIVLHYQWNHLLSSVVFPLVVNSYYSGVTDGSFPVDKQRTNSRIKVSK